MKFLPTEASTYVVFCDYFLGAQILNVHELNTNLNYLSSNVLSLYCIFDVQNLVLCLNRELIKMIDYKFMLKLQCKTTFNSVFVGKKIIKIEQVDFGIMFLKNMVLHEIYSKKSFCPNTFDQRLCIYNIHFSKTVLIILLAFLFT
jgi:hypothetical protein